MWALAALPFILQGVLMLVDEGFHLRRGLPAWERWGHPVDTLSVAACFALAAILPATAAGLWAYAAAAVVSCLCVTKDEWVHARHCSGAECWLHACLFLLHPVLLALVGAWAFHGPLRADGDFHRGFGFFLALQGGLTALFGIWQAVYWNGPWRPAAEAA